MIIAHVSKEGGVIVKMKLFVILGFLAALCVASIGAAPATLKLWTRAYNQAQLAPIVEKWNSKGGAQIEVLYVPDNEYVTKVSTAFATNSEPDILSSDVVYMPQLNQAGRFADLTAKIKGLPFGDKLIAGHIAIGSYKGKKYAVPFSADTSVLFYNKDLFKKAGLDPETPPKTWANVISAAGKIRALGDDYYGFYFSGASSGGFAFTWLPAIWASGGDIFNADATAATIDQPIVRDALSYYKKMVDNKYVPAGAAVDSGANWTAPFLTGKVGMIINGPSTISLLKKEHPEIDFGVALIPGKNGGSGSFTGGDDIAIAKRSKNIDEAWKFLSFLLSEEMQLEFYAKNGYPTLRSDLTENQYVRSDARLVTVNKAVSIGRCPYTFKYNELINDTNGPFGKLCFTAVFQSDVNAAATKAQEEFTKILNE
jgi:multiple sugar transport system substrate-binding protein